MGREPPRRTGSLAPARPLGSSEQNGVLHQRAQSYGNVRARNSLGLSLGQKVRTTRKRVIKNSNIWRRDSPRRPDPCAPAGRGEGRGVRAGATSPPDVGEPALLPAPGRCPVQRQPDHPARTRGPLPRRPGVVPGDRGRLALCRPAQRSTSTLALRGRGTWRAWPRTVRSEEGAVPRPRGRSGSAGPSHQR